MTRPQLIKKIRGLINPDSSGKVHYCEIGIAPGLKIRAEMSWESDNEPTCCFDIIGAVNFKSLKKQNGVCKSDWSKLLKFYEQILAICKESDILAKSEGIDPGEYWNDILVEIEKGGRRRDKPTRDDA